jgi:hypothetical protein
LYVDIRDDGGVASEPTTSGGEFETEFAHAAKLMEFAGDVDRKCVFAFKEYELFGDIFRSMFAESLEPPEEVLFATEEYPSGIPGIVLVKKTITVADVATESESAAGSLA